MCTKSVAMPVLFVPLLLLFVAVSATPVVAQAQTTKLTVQPAGLPVDLWDTPLGSEGTLTFNLPTDLSRYTEAILLLHVDDIDAQPETGLYVNGHGRLTWPESILGEGEHCGAIRLNMAHLKPGPNEFKFVFEDTLNWHTTGFAILGAELQLFTELSSEQLSHILKEAATWGMPEGWTPQVTPPDQIIQQTTKPRVSLGWKNHYIRVGDGHGGWTVKCAQYQLLHHPRGGDCKGFGVAQMDNGEIILLGTWKPSKDEGEKTVVAFSSDGGCTWSDLKQIDDLGGRPVMLAYLGGPNLTAYFGGGRRFSHDYGRTWTELVPNPPASDGGFFGTEGNPLVDRDEQGMVTRMAEVGWNWSAAGQNAYPQEPEDHFLRWSYDGGRTWTDETQPQAWRWTDIYKGKSYLRGVSEGSLVRAQNGWLIAALRSDMPARYLDQPHNDSVEGIGVSISKDNGKTWSPIKIIFEAGRHHPNLLLMPSGDIVMTMTVRVDVRGGKLATYRRGCDAVISHDNGLSWDLAHRYVLDEYEYYDGKQWYNGECGHLYSTLLDDGSILTIHSNYLTKGISLIRWRP